VHYELNYSCACLTIHFHRWQEIG